MSSISQNQLRLSFDTDEGYTAFVHDTIICRTCALPKSRDEFYIKDRKTGRRYTQCKICFIAESCARSKKAYEADPERFRERTRQWCEANPEKAKETRRKSNKKHAARIRATENAYRTANPEKTREKRKRYRAKHKDVIDAGHARYREANHERLRERHKQWRDTHIERLHEIVSDAKHRRRARLAGSGGSHTAAEWNGLKEFYDYTCLLCNRREPEIKLTRDHYIPISRGGTNDIDNIIPLCKSCNSRKHAKLIKIELLHVQTPDESL
jgi:5-methylcytosine-specific restriction endonuclease McrA